MRKHYIVTGRELYVDESRLTGQGVFTPDKISEGELICFMQGEVVSIEDLKRRFVSKTLRPCDPLQVSERLYLDLGKPQVYFNHSCSPNSSVSGIGELRAFKSINSGEEIRYDYSTTEWTADYFGRFEKWAMRCRCGSGNCRRTIEQFPFLPVHLQRNYIQRGAVQDFIIHKVALRLRRDLLRRSYKLKVQ